jgi:hypothetical protein
MGTPSQPVNLNPAQVAELIHNLSKLRHDTNNHLTLISTVVELIRRNPESASRLIGRLGEQPQKIREELLQFSRELEALLGIKRE